MKKSLLSLAALLISAMSFAEQTSVEVKLADGTSGSNPVNITWTAVNGNLSVMQTAGSGATSFGSYASAPRVYRSNILTFSAAEGYTIDSVLLTVNNNYYGNNILGATALGQTPAEKDTIDVVDNNIVIDNPATSGCVIKIANKGAASTFYIQNTANESNTQIRPTKIVLVYTKEASSEPTIEAGDVAMGTVAVGGNDTKTLDVIGENLTGAITYSLSEGAPFEVTGDLTAAGGTLTVAYVGTEEGEAEATLTLASGETTKTINITANAVSLTGEGTEENPYTVSDVIKLNNGKKGEAWVKGYILGSAKTTDNVLSVNPTSEASNILLGETKSESGALMACALPNNSIRTALNVVDNANNVGKYVAIKGSLEAYFNNPGLKAPSAYKWLTDPSTAIENSAVEVKAVKFFRNGQLVIVRDGIEYNVLGAQL